jgi:predicted NAD/FAD-binding protein
MSFTHALKMLNLKPKAANNSIPVLDHPKSMDYKNLIRLMGLLAGTPSWVNGRDVETLAKTFCRLVFMNVWKAEDELVCTIETVRMTIVLLLQERCARTVKRC